MRTSEKVGSICKAFVAMQKEVKAAVKNNENSHLKSKYADLASVWDAAQEALQKNGFAVAQTPVTEGGKHFLVTRLVHETGEWFEGDMPIIVRDENNPQAFGSGLTYARRYAFASMVGVRTEDDDAAAAATAGHRTTVKAKTPTGIDERTRLGFWKQVKELGLSDERVKVIVEQVRGTTSTMNMTEREMNDILARCRAAKAQEA